MIVNLHPDIADLEPRLKLFVEAMAYKLYKNAKKGAWEGISLEQTLTHMKGEVEELNDAIERRNNIEIVMEAADIANFAMIVADIATDKGQRK